MSTPPRQPPPDARVLRTVELPSGTLVIRPSERGDTAGLIDLFDSLPADDRYSRFFSAFRPDDAFVEKLASGNERGACSLVAVLRGPDGQERVIGEAGAWPLPNGNGELGITVARDLRGWLGPYLLDALLEVAAGAGMPNLEAEVLTTNRRMHTLLRDRGAAVAGHDGYLTLRVVISTGATVPTWPAADGRRRVLVETPGARWPAEPAVASRGFQVIACGGPANRPGRRPCPALQGGTCPLARDADVVVVRYPPGAPRDELVAAHQAVHPGVPVCIALPGEDANVVDLVSRVERLAASGQS
jgi:hypothetical protein